jgi:CRP/FNR family transcriptional regulator
MVTTVGRAMPWASVTVVRCSVMVSLLSLLAAPVAAGASTLTRTVGRRCDLGPSCCDFCRSGRSCDDADVQVDARAAAAAGPLARLPAEALTRLLDGLIVVRVAAGGVFYRPGDRVGLHLVADGLIRVSMASEEGRQVTVRYARAGDVLGIPVTVAESAPVCAQAVTDAVVVATRPGVLPQLGRRDARVAMWMAEELAERVDGLLYELAMNTFWPVRRRLGRHLLDLAVDAQTGQDLVVRASHQQLADHIGTVREVVARTLATLRTDGIIGTDADGIHLLDPHSLAAS